MKQSLILFFTLALLVSCQDVVELDLNTAAPQLVIDASVELNEDGTTTSTVKLTRTAGFYVENNPTVDNASVTITDSNGQLFTFTHTGDGIYNNQALNVEDDLEYTLTINDQGDIYSSTQRLERTVPIIEVSQEIISGFGDDVLRITAFYNDPEGTGDYYLFEYNDDLNEQIDIGDDEFTDGNRSPTIFFLEDFEEGLSTQITIKGINQRCYSFYETLLQQSGDGGGGPFDPQPATVKGNIINTTNPDKFPFGYFRISEVFTFDYVIQANP